MYAVRRSRVVLFHQVSIILASKSFLRENSYRVSARVKPEPIAGRIDQILHQGQYRHRSGSARIRREPSRDLTDRVEVDVAGETSRPDSPKADVDDARARLHHIRRYQEL